MPKLCHVGRGRCALGGGWSPVAAVRSAVLLARVHSAVRHVQAAADPARRLAADVGYLTWPRS
jgi:hypothetical protein